MWLLQCALFLPYLLISSGLVPWRQAAEHSTDFLGSRQPFPSSVIFGALPFKASFVEGHLLATTF